MAEYIRQNPDGMASDIAAILACLVYITYVLLQFFPGLVSQYSYMDIKIIVEKAGYSNVHVVDWHPLAPGRNGCGGQDDVAYSVKADIVLNIEKVDLSVCCGTGIISWTKGCAIRTH